RRGHLLLGDDEDPVEHAAGDVVPALHGTEDTGAAADVGADHRLVPAAGTVGEVLPFHVDAVEGVGGRTDAHRVDVVDRQPGGVEGGPGGLPGELLAGLEGPPDETGHTRSHHRDPAPHR